MLVKHLVHCLNDVVIHIVHPFFSNCNSYLIDSFLQHTFDKKNIAFPCTSQDDRRLYRP